MANRILLVGGGTGGHVYPLVAVAEELRKLSPEVELQFIGDGGLLGKEAANLGIKYRKILAPKWRRYFSFLNLVDLLKLPIGFFQSLFFVWWFMPEVIFIKGGYASMLPALVAKIFFIPLVIHESDAVPGRTNRLFGGLADKIFVSLEVAKKYFRADKTEMVGNPIRLAITSPTDPLTARQSFGLDANKPTVLITGASQGAETINSVLLLALTELIQKFQIIHQTGSGNFEKIKSQIEQIKKEGKDSYGENIAANYRTYASFDAGQMAQAYGAANVIVSRSGSSIYEIAAIGRPAILIPLKNSASNHQLANAREMAKFGAIVIEEDNLTPHILLREIEVAYENRATLGQKIKDFAKLGAAGAIANCLLSYR